MADIYAEVKVYEPANSPGSGEYSHVGLQVQVTGDSNDPIRIGLLCTPNNASGHTPYSVHFEVWKKATDTDTSPTRIKSMSPGVSTPWTIRATDNGSTIVWQVNGGTTEGIDQFTEPGPIRLESSPYYRPKVHALHLEAASNTVEFDDFTWNDANQPGPSWTDGFGSDSGKWLLAGGAGGTWSLVGGRLRATLTGWSGGVRWCNRETRFRAPSAPSTLYVDSTDAQSGSANPTNIDLTPVFSAIFDSPNDQTDGTGDPEAAYQLQVSTDSTFASVTHWNSGWVSQTTADGARCANIAYGGSALSNSQTYYWRIRWYDDHGGYGSSWSAAGTFFTTQEAAATITGWPRVLYSHSTTAQAGDVNPRGIDLTPVFSALNQIGLTATRYNLAVYSDMGCQNLLWMSGLTNFASSVADGARCENLNYGGGTLETCTQYWWRIQMGDATDLSAWSKEYAFFRHHLPQLGLGAAYGRR